MDDLSTTTVPGPSQKFEKRSGEGREALGHYLGTGGLKPWPCLRQRTKNTLFRFKAIYWQLQYSKFTLKSRLLYTWNTNKFLLEIQIDGAGNTLMTDSHEIIYHVLGQAHRKPYSLS